ncbi:MAG: exodeoxyribonuclease large subunit [Actinomycetota bacterium]|jgi:exodeoxyribonuclease VII large subunit|nr:exodeoxyribonuclease large subunit [Actinomycetota bacterium]
MGDAFTVGEVLHRVRNAAAREFRGPIWVVGEIRKVGDRTGTLYLDLVEPGGGRWEGGDVSLNAACFKTRWRRLQAELADAGAELAVGREVRLCGTVTVWDNGRVFLELTAVDIAALVGRRAAERERIIRELAAAGLLERNRGRPLPVVPLRVGLVGSRDSDGYRDFLGVLDRSGYAFVVTFVHAPVQGPAAGIALAGAVGALEGVDVVCLVRGGGAELDAFDAEVLARAIAACEVPVLTGIGHTADRSVADAAAHLACTTPTGCAQALVARVAAFDQTLAERNARLAGAGAAMLGRCSDTVRSVAGALARGTRREIEASALELSRKRLRLSPANLADRLDGRGEHLAGAATRLLVAGRRTLDEALRIHAGHVTHLRAHAPDRILARGYSLTRTAAGELVRDGASLATGDVIVTTFAAGAATSVVSAPAPGAVPEEEQ